MKKMKKLMMMMMCLFTVACNSSNASKLDEPRKNVARDNAMASFPDAKCDEIGFEEPTLHSVRCTLKNGVRLYCSAGQQGTGCTPIYAPEEVQKAQQDADAARQKAQQEAAAKAAEAQSQVKKTK